MPSDTGTDESRRIRRRSDSPSLQLNPFTVSPASPGHLSSTLPHPEARVRLGLDRSVRRRTGALSVAASTQQQPHHHHARPSRIDADGVVASSSRRPSHTDWLDSHTLHPRTLQEEASSSAVGPRWDFAPLSEEAGIQTGPSSRVDEHEEARVRLNQMLRISEAVDRLSPIQPVATFWDDSTDLEQVVPDHWDADGVRPSSLVGSPVHGGDTEPLPDDEILGLPDFVEESHWTDFDNGSTGVLKPAVVTTPSASPVPPPAPSTYLQPGVRFVGRQCTVAPRSLRSYGDRADVQEPSCPYASYNPLDEVVPSTTTRTVSSRPRGLFQHVTEATTRSGGSAATRALEEAIQAWRDRRAVTQMNHQMAHGLRPMRTSAPRYHPFQPPTLPSIHDRLSIQGETPASEPFQLSDSDDWASRRADDDQWYQVFSRHIAPLRDGTVEGVGLESGSRSLRRSMQGQFRARDTSPRVADVPLTTSTAASSLRIQRRRERNHDWGTTSHSESIVVGEAEWSVGVTITKVDWENGTIEGVMQAEDIRRKLNHCRTLDQSHDGMLGKDESTHHSLLKTKDEQRESRGNEKSSKAIVTGFEGEIIDFDGRSIWTEKWESHKSIDIEYWSKAPPLMEMKRNDLIDLFSNRDKCRQVTSDYILMRWKETSFINCEQHESGLSIRGYYYGCMNRSTGSIQAFYWDPDASPYQRLSLDPAGHLGFACSTMSFA